MRRSEPFTRHLLALEPRQLFDGVSPVDLPQSHDGAGMPEARHAHTATRAEASRVDDSNRSARGGERLGSSDDDRTRQAPPQRTGADDARGRAHRGEADEPRSRHDRHRDDLDDDRDDHPQAEPIDPRIEAGPDDSVAASILEDDSVPRAAGTLSLVDPDAGQVVRARIETVTVEGDALGALDTTALAAMLSLMPEPVMDGTAIAGTLAWVFDGAGLQLDALAEGERVTIEYGVRLEAEALADRPHDAYEEGEQRDEDDCGPDASDRRDDDDRHDEDTYPDSPGKPPAAPWSALQTIRITFIGTNDRPTIEVSEEGDSAAAQLDEADSPLLASGTLTVRDADRSDVVQAAVAFVDAQGELGAIDPASLAAMMSIAPQMPLDAETVKGTLVWLFDSGTETFDHLPEGGLLTLTYEVTVTDPYGAADTHRIEVHIRGTNDRPTIAVSEEGDSAAAQLDEADSPLLASGTLTVRDADRSDVVQAAVAFVDAQGELGAIDPASLAAMMSLAPQTPLDAESVEGTLVWLFDSGSETFDHLPEGGVLTLAYEVTVTDPHGATDTHRIEVHIRGTNDAPAIEVGPGDSDSARLTETDAALTTSGTLTVFDADRGDRLTASVSLLSSDMPVGGPLAAALEAMLSVGAAEALPDASRPTALVWTFDSGTETFDLLREGETVTLRYRITVTDASGAQVANDVEIVIVGTQDAAQITGESLGSVGESGPLVARGVLGVTDPDRGEAGFATPDPQSLRGLYGDFTFDPATGEWTYTVDPDREATRRLPAGETVTERLDIASLDGSAVRGIVVQVQGTNTPPVASDLEITVEEDGVSTGRLPVATDRDLDAVRYELATGPAHGTVTVTEDGEFRYVPAPDFNGFDLFTYRIDDGQGGTAIYTVRISVTPVNDAPVIDAPRQGRGDVYEDGATDARPDTAESASGQFRATDPDVGDTQLWSVVDSGEGAWGTLSIDPQTGAWRYQLDNVRAQPLHAGETRVETFRIRVQDGAGAQDEAEVQITIHGQADFSLLIDVSEDAGVARFIEGFGPVPIAPTLSIVDGATEPRYDVAFVVLEDARPGDRLQWAEPPAGITARLEGATLIFEGVGSRTAYEALLRSVTFEHTGPDATAGGTAPTRSIAITLQDPSGGSASTRVALQVRELSIEANPATVVILDEDSSDVPLPRDPVTGTPRDLDFQVLVDIDGVVTDVTAELLAQPDLTVRATFLDVPRGVDGAPRGRFVLDADYLPGAEFVGVTVEPSPERPLQMTFEELRLGRLRFVPDADDYGLRMANAPYRIELLRASGGDGAGESMVIARSEFPAPLHFSVRERNDAPVYAGPASITLGVGAAWSAPLDALFSDIDLRDVGTLRMAVESIDGSARVSLVDGVLIVRNDSIAPGTTRVVLTARDSAGVQVRGVLDVSLDPTAVFVGNAAPQLSISAFVSATDVGADLPVAAGEPIRIDEGTTRVAQLASTDPDGNPLAYALGGPDARLFRIDASGVVRLLEPLDAEAPIDADRDGLYDLRVSVTDGRGGVQTRAVQIAVNDVLEGAQPIDPTGQAVLVVPLAADGTARGEFDLDAFFASPDGLGPVSFALRNPEELAQIGIRVELVGNRLSVTLPRTFSGYADLQLTTWAGGIELPGIARLAVDRDADGVDDFAEAFVGDRNLDGIPDGAQTNVASFAGSASYLNDPATYYTLVASSLDNRWLDALTASAPGGFVASLRLGTVTVSEIDGVGYDGIDGVLAASDTPPVAGSVRTPIGAFAFTIEPDLSGLATGDEASRAFAARLMAAFSASQQVVRVILPEGADVRTFVKTVVGPDGRAQSLEFLKAPLLDAAGQPMRDAAGNALYTGAEFIDLDADGRFDEALLYYVDNQRGDDDPGLGRIVDPGAFVGFEPGSVAPPGPPEPPAPPAPPVPGPGPGPGPAPAAAIDVFQPVPFLVAQPVDDRAASLLAPQWLEPSLASADAGRVPIHTPLGRLVQFTEHLDPNRGSETLVDYAGWRTDAAQDEETPAARGDATPTDSDAPAPRDGSSVALDARPDTHAARGDAGSAPRWSATLADGRPLPAWVVFDAASGRLHGTPPRGAPDALVVRVHGVDALGRETETVLYVRFDPPQAGATATPAQSHRGESIATQRSEGRTRFSTQLAHLHAEHQAARSAPTPERVAL